MAGAVYFKNYIKRHWVNVSILDIFLFSSFTNYSKQDNEDAVNKIAEQDRVEIKNQIVQLMITVPEKLQLQISDALTLIAASDFPEKWESLLPVNYIMQKKKKKKTNCIL